jgi:hypothetical protein|tara:strand:- start:8 stop:109 length:102 start_codon:yes stop_codon:yes gene_type:complete
VKYDAVKYDAAISDAVKYDAAISDAINEQSFFM